MKLLRALLHITMLFLVAATAKADMEPIPFSAFTASYRGEANGISVEKLGKRSLTSLGDNQYQIEYNASAMVYSLKETSVFSWHQNVPRPQRYDSSRGTFLKKRENHIRFNWETGKGHYEHKKKEGDFELVAGMQDALTGTLFLALELDAGKSEISFMEAKDNDQEVRKFVLLDTPELDTDVGKIRTFHLKRLHDDEKRQTEIWLHQEYPYIPVKVQQYDDGDKFLLELTDFRFN